MCDQDNEGGDDCLKVVTIMMRMVIDNISGILELVLVLLSVMMMSF